MKKRILSFIVAVLFLIPCLCVTVFAQKSDITILNGGKNLKYNGNQYVRFDSSLVYFEAEEYLEDIRYDNIEIKSADYDISKNSAMITAYFNYRDGSTLTASFINEAYYSEYLSLLETADNYVVDFYYPEYNTVPAQKELLFDEKVTLKQNQLLFCYEAKVYAQNSDKSYQIEKGSLLVVNNNYYYVDYKEAGITDPFEFLPSEMQSLEAYKITNTELCKQLAEAYGEYGGEGLLTNGFFGSVSAVFVIFIFAVIPLAILVLFIFLYIRSKTPSYKKLFLSICITAAVEIVIFTTMFVLFMVF